MDIEAGGSRRQREDALFANTLRLTALAADAEAAQLVLHAAEAPFERTVSVVSSGAAILELEDVAREQQPATQTWCRSTATQALIGPSGEQGWVAVGHRSAQHFDEATTETLTVAATLLEAILDNDLENTILNELAVQLLGSSITAATPTSLDPAEPA